MAAASISHISQHQHLTKYCSERESTVATRHRINKIIEIIDVF